jgi:hypothetical protein
VRCSPISGPPGSLMIEDCFKFRVTLVLRLRRVYVKYSSLGIPEQRNQPARLFSSRMMRYLDLSKFKEFSAVGISNFRSLDCTMMA